MELGDFDTPNEFEFDLSDVDVAAFESVATEDTAVPAAQDQQQPPAQPAKDDELTQPPPKPPQQSQPQQQQQEHQQQLNQTQQQQPQTPSQQPPSHLLPQQQPQHLHQQHNNLIATTVQNAPSGKILLVPINAKPGSPVYKQLLQLPAGVSPLTMGALSSSGAKKHIIQLAPVATCGHQQTLSLNTVMNKTLSSVQNSSSNFPQAHLASSRNISYNDSLRTSTPNPNPTNEVPKRKPCNCTKSQCLKLYCDCFANGEFCSGCNCTNCFNSLDNEKERQKAISQCLERNPEAFRPKIGKAVKSSVGEPALESIERRHTKGCNCKRSGCLKNYCECYEAKILCSNLCKCCGCKNYEESFERKSLMQLANSSSDHVRGVLKNLLPTNHGPNSGKESTKCFITDKVVRASLKCLLQSAQQAEKDGVSESNIPNLLQIEMGKCLRMIVDSSMQPPTSTKKR